MKDEVYLRQMAYDGLSIEREVRLAIKYQRGYAKDYLQQKVDRLQRSLNNLSD